MNRFWIRAPGAVGVLMAVLLAQGCASGPWKGPQGPAFNGTIESVDMAARQLTIAPLESGLSERFAWDENSRFWAKGLRIEPTFLQVRDIVRIHYRVYFGQRTISIFTCRRTGQSTELRGQGEIREGSPEA